MKVTIDINYNILIWATERAGYSLDEISKRFPKFTHWLKGEKRPTIKQLEKFAKYVHIPFGYLFLEKPPVEKLPIPFFRTFNAKKREISLNVLETILTLQRRQEWLSEYLKDNEYPKLDFVSKFKGFKDVYRIVDDIRKTLALKLNWAGEFPTWERAKDHLVRRIEENEIIVVFNSVVENNTHRKIDVEECRGFVLVDEYAPFMFINSADYKSAQIFTLAHELAHIWIGESAGFDFRQLLPAEDQIEILCDKIAAEFLVPEQLFQEVWSDDRDFDELAKYFKVSQIVIARRALDLGKITRKEYLDFYNNYINRQKGKKGTQEGGGDFYSLQKRRLSIRFLNFVNHAIKENKLLYHTAYQLTGLRGDTFHKLMKEHL